MSDNLYLSLISADLDRARESESESQNAVHKAKQSLADAQDRLVRARIKRESLEELHAKAKALHDSQGKSNVGEDVEADEVAQSGGEEVAQVPRAPIGALSNSQRDRMAEHIIDSLGRFVARGDVIEGFEAKGYDLEPHHVRTVLSRLYDDGRIVRLTYGTSSHFTAYGLPRFVKDEDGDLKFANDEVKPTFHADRDEEPRFEWERSQMTPFLNGNASLAHGT